MERCPNCGAPARPGAKFCTTCGYRLPVAVPINQPAATNDTPATSATSSWPPPPAPPAEAPASDQPQAEVTDEVAGQEQIIATETQSAGDEVVVVPVTVGDSETDDPVVAAAADSADTASSTDSVVSYSWPSPAAASKTSPWSGSDTSATSEETVVDTNTSTTVDAVVEAAGEDVIAEEAVTEETVVVAEPASQYEGWSAAVVEDLASPAASHGTNVARATALLDELRLLLPVLNSGSGSGEHDLIAGELEAALATNPETSGDRQALRAALNDARDNPRDIQTILGLAQQADAAIALLNDHDRLTTAVRQAIASLRPTTPGLYPDEN